MKRTKKAGLALFFVLQLALTTIYPMTAFAQAPSDTLALPCGFSVKDGNPSATKSCLEIEFKNRATVVIRFPQDANKKIITSVSTSNVKFEVFTGTYIRNTARTSEYNAKDGPKDKDRKTNSQLRFKGDNSPFSGTRDNDELQKRWKKLSAEDLAKIMKSSNSGIRFVTLSNDANRNEPYPLGRNVCSGKSEDQFVGIVASGNDVKWNCADGQDGATDEVEDLAKNVVNLDKFNITHTANSDATKLSIVFPDNDNKKDSFVYCEEARSYALQSCEDPRDDFTIKAKPADFSGSGVKTVEVSDGGDHKFNMVVAKSDNEEASTPGTDSGSGESAGEGESPGCEGGSLDWVICPLTNGLASLADGIVANFLQPVLRAQILELPGATDENSAALFGVWKSFRNIANATLILAFLVIIISSALSSE